MLKTQKNLFLIGGNEERTPQAKLLSRFVSLCGKYPHIIIISGASSFPEEVATNYSELFKTLGASHVHSVFFKSRDEGSQKENLESLKLANGVFITGGNQVKLIGAMGGTPFHKLLLERVNNGLMYGGTSAGASIVSRIMIAGGRGSFNPRKNTVKISSGLGLLDGVIIDQHFRERNRLYRLATAVSTNPVELAVGIDENTAIHIVDNRLGIVYGANSVTILDGKEMSYTGFSETIGTDPIAMFGMKFHVLTKGFKFDLIKRCPVFDNIKSVADNQQKLSEVV
ncbi:MAG: cyanophycinase [Candidatus Marinimicrobia bacterium]|jgi:cyanophycinase|nr:cyanophycinase [Candidatus Neomarinimicrobiota bacterium]MBT3937312.1 cyanophycinase [Candidatus Neomarinimicrobiota bacterium]MBT4635506.1 cyanophycinase [Candidatus Neomarinimicrobiota bacterium]MBT5362625.1 cyanophycinase [Candidatus Neomarinimicrobiota bacterium]MBT5461593.1 cyanophycinase [Candidatus Neomarinimicrobiota bacterium]